MAHSEKKIDSFEIPKKIIHTNNLLCIIDLDVLSRCCRYIMRFGNISAKNDPVSNPLFETLDIYRLG